VAIYARTELPIFDMCKEVSTPGVEAAWAKTVVGTKSLLIGVIYRPPNEKADYWAKLEENLELAKEVGIDTIILTGDLNNNLLHPPSKLNEILENFHFEQFIKDPTHITEYSATLLDIFATTSADLVKEAKVRPPSLSNHSDVVARIDVNKPKAEKYKRQVYDYEKANWELLRGMIGATDWETILQTTDIDKMTEDWTSTLTRLMDCTIPSKEITVSSRDMPWMSPHIHKLKKKNNQKHKKARNSNKARDWEAFHEARARLTEEIKAAKQNHQEGITRKIKECSGRNEKLWWKLTKAFYSKTKNLSHQSPPPHQKWNTYQK
jgi:Icc-related predicted phosphoesterase